MGKQTSDLWLSAKDLAELVVIAQRVRPGPTNHRTLKFRGGGFERQRYVHGLRGHGVIRVFWSEDARPVLVALRHTREGFEWLNNFQQTKINSSIFPGTQVHLGFLQSIQQIDKTTKLPVPAAIMRHLREAGAHRRPVIVMGHSRGGALAQLLAPGIVREFGERHPGVRVVTFGAPRAYDVRGARQFDQIMVGNHLFLLRVTLGSDVVPALPLSGFSHVGHHVWLRGGYIVHNPSPLSTWFHRVVHLQTAFSDHATKRYQQVLLAHHQRQPDRVW